MLSIIEQNALGHFMYLPKVAGFSVNQNDSLTIINCGLGSSMFNIAYGSLDPTSQDYGQKIQQVIDLFNGQPFAWWVPPSLYSSELNQELLKYGFVIEAAEHAMLCNLGNFTNTAASVDLVVEHVLNSSQLKHFISILEPYDSTVRSFYENLTPPMLKGREKLYVGYENGTPVAISILFIEGEAAGVFSLLTCENKRGRGYGAYVINHLMQIAKENGIRYITLSASSDSGFRIYERLGFQTLGQFQCFEWKGN